MLTAKVLKLAQWAKDSSNEHVTNGFRPFEGSGFSVSWAHEVLKGRFPMRKIDDACGELVEAGLLVRYDSKWWPHTEQPVQKRWYKLAPEQTPQ